LVASVLLLAAACGGKATESTRSGPPTYSEVVRTYPKDAELCSTVASIVGVGQGEENWLLDGDIEFRDSQMMVKCYGTKITADMAVTIDGTTYPAGTMLTVDEDLNWIVVSSWD